MTVLRVILLIGVLLSPAICESSVPGKLYWRGMVDDKLQLIIHDDQLEAHVMSGKEYPAGVFSFTAPLPHEETAVTAKMVKGRGAVTVVQQPTLDNDFTATVEINDDRGGAKEYQLEISWN